MDIIETIKEQIAANTVLLYMKGSPNAPQCGFSSTVHGNDITMKQQCAKLKLVVDIAEDVWGAS